MHGAVQVNRKYAKLGHARGACICHLQIEEYKRPDTICIPQAYHSGREDASAHLIKFENGTPFFPRWLRELLASRPNDSQKVRQRCAGGCFIQEISVLSHVTVFFPNCKFPSKKQQGNQVWAKYSFRLLVTAVPASNSASEASNVWVVWIQLSYILHPWQTLRTF